MPTSWFRYAAITAVTALATSGLMINAAQAVPHRDDPIGTQLLTNSPSASPDVPTVVGVAPAGIIYNDSHGLWVFSPSTGTATQLAGAGNVGVDSIGKMLWFTTPAGQLKWYDTNAGTSGNVPGGWTAPSPTGGLYEQIAPDGTIHVFNQNISNGRIYDLGALPAWAKYNERLTPGLNGVLALGRRAGNAIAARYLGYSDSINSVTPSLTGIPATDTLVCGSAATTSFGCADTTSGSAVRLTLDGSAPDYVTPTRPIAAAPVVTDSVMAWSVSMADGTQQLQSAVLGTNTIVTMSSPNVGVGTSIGADATQLYVPTAGDTTGDTGAIVALNSAAGQPAVVRADPRLGLTVSALALGPGRVGWEDDSQTGQPVWSRTFSNDGTNIDLDARAQVATGVQTGSLGVGGVRTGYILPTNLPTLADGVNAPVTLSRPGTNVEVSGTRMVYQRVGGYDSFLYDNVRNHGTDLTTTYNMTSTGLAALWGNSIAWINSDGTVWRTDLTGGTPMQVGPALPRGRTLVYGGVWMWSHYVAWSVVSTDGSSYYNLNQFVDTSTVGNNPVNAPASQSIVGASAAGIELLNGATYTLQSWDGTNSMTIPGSMAVAEGDTVAWVGADGFPRVAPVSYPVVDRPQSLGNPFTTSALNPDGTWSIDQPTSAPLTNCSIVFADGNGNQVDSVNCDPAAMAQGEIKATWTPAAGLPNATYTWTVHASNGDGNLLAANGTNQATSGPLLVSPVIATVRPPNVAHGSTGVTMIITGSRFDSTAAPKFGPGVKVRSVVVDSSSHLTVMIDVSSAATISVRNVVVSTTGAADAVCSKCFNVT